MSARNGSRIIGVQGAEAARFSILRTPDTFSWLTQGGATLRAFVGVARPEDA